MWQVVKLKHDKFDNITTKRAYKPKNMMVAKLENPEIGLKISVHLYLPNDLKKCKQILISIHGKNRNSRHYRNIFVPKLAKKNVLILAPRLKAEKIRHKEALIYGNSHKESSSGDLLPKNEWTFVMLDEIIVATASYLGIDYQKIDLFGHSAGAQFAQRLPFFHDIRKLDKIIVANPGWFTFPDVTKSFPYGLKNITRNGDLKRIFSKKIIFITGSKDTHKRHLKRRGLDSAVGKNRHERALFFFDSSKKIAKKNKFDFKWKLVIVKGLGHSAKKSAFIASKYV